MMLLGSPLTPLENALHDVLYWLHGTIGFTWAWSIVALTVIVRPGLPEAVAANGFDWLAERVDEVLAQTKAAA